MPKPGRPKGFAGLAKDLRRDTNDGQELREFALKVMRGELDPTPAQLHAHAWITDRAYGKPTQSIELQTFVDKDGDKGRTKVAFHKLTTEELIAYKALVDKMGKTDDDGEDGEGGEGSTIPPFPIKAKMLPSPDGEGEK